MLSDEARAWISAPVGDPDCHIAVGQKLMRDLAETNDLLREMMQEERDHFTTERLQMDCEIHHYRWVLALAAKQMCMYGILHGIFSKITAPTHPTLAASTAILEILQATDRWPE